MDTGHFRPAGLCTLKQFTGARGPGYVCNRGQQSGSSRLVKVHHCWCQFSFSISQL